MFAGSSASGPVISGWSGDTSMAQNAVGGTKAPQQAALSGLFSKQNSPQSTGLASDPHAQDTPWGNPTDTTRAVMTQGYGVGSHTPAAVWGGIDIAVDGDGDGNADPRGSMGAPLYATMSGVIELDPNSVPAGNHLWIKNEHFKVGYGHLKEFAVQDGQTVQRGDLIAYMGSTGNSSGPHLHYHIWQDGTNVNPLDFGAMP
ncbi:MAG: M23 family peptidase [Chloroflexi bacterium]|nr:MAG: M23 family peptidase [Chloroflexota bacterium]